MTIFLAAEDDSDFKIVHPPKRKNLAMGVYTWWAGPLKGQRLESELQLAIALLSLSVFLNGCCTLDEVHFQAPEGNTYSLVPDIWEQSGCKVGDGGGRELSLDFESFQGFY